MLVDTGSPVSVIPRSVFERHRGKWPRLQATTMKLSCFKGPLPINGKLQLNATMSGATIQAKLFVIDCPEPMLCGRDTIRSFNTAGMPVLTGNEAGNRVLKSAPPPCRSVQDSPVWLRSFHSRPK
ncbi:hypothetical protein MRX96_023462 [Rhipicephalus microplus]